MMAIFSLIVVISLAMARERETGRRLREKEGGGAHEG